MLLILSHLLSVIVGLFVAVFAEPLRRSIYKPRLELFFGEGKEFQTLTPFLVDQKAVHKGVFIRIKVTNKSRFLAKECRAYLINVEKKEGSVFKSTDYVDSLQLAWSCREKEKYESIDLAKGVNQFIDLLHTEEGSPHMAPDYFPKQMRYAHLFKTNGIYKYTVQVAAEYADPKTLEIVVEWSGKWDEFKAYKF